MSRTALTLRAQLFQKLASGEYKGLLFAELKRLRPQLATEHCDAEEIKGWLNFWAVEAISIYDRSRRTKPSTWIVQHIRLQALNFQQSTWCRSSGNKKCRKCEMPLEMQDDDGHPPVALLHKFSNRDDATVGIELADFAESLSAEERQLWEKFFAFPRQQELIDALNSDHYRSKVSRLLGISPKQVEEFRQALRRRWSGEQPPASGEQILSLREVARILRCGLSTVKRLIEAGRLPTIRVGSARGWRRVRREDLERFLGQGQ